MLDENIKLNLRAIIYGALRPVELVHDGFKGRLVDLRHRGLVVKSES
jgi:hypothetical protein